MAAVFVKGRELVSFVNNDIGRDLGDEGSWMNTCFWARICFS